MIGFYLAKLLRNEKALMRYSRTETSVLDTLAGKTVALVGNARSLGQTELGAAIDQADIVIRMNTAPMPSAISHGHRTDWLATSIALPESRVKELAPALVMWMTSKRKRLPWYLAQSGKLFLFPVLRSANLMGKLRSRPTTGIMAIELLAHSKAEKIDLYGFDFFASLSLSGKREAKDVPHDFVAEAAYVDRLLAKDTRFTLNR